MKFYPVYRQLLTYYAGLFNISPLLMRASNPHIKTDYVEPNELIYVPGYDVIIHNVTKNDTIQSICEKYNVHIDLIVVINSDFTPEGLQPTLHIPIRINDLVIKDADVYTYDKMIKDIDYLLNIYPFIQKNIIGYSVLNKPIIELKIGNGSYHTHFNGSFHGNEWITSSAIMHCLNEYARLLIKSSEFIDTFDKTCVSIVPMVNPDGVNLAINGLDSAEVFQDDVYLMNEKREDFSRWKANIRGVDLNKQFPALWDLEQKRKPKFPTYRDFPGTEPLIEPESITMRTLTYRNNFHRVHAFHTQGEEVYWGFNSLEPELAEKIASHYARVSHYELIRDIDNYAGYKDWFIKQFRRPGFTIELGKGVNPLPIEQFPKVYDVSLNIFFANLALIV